MHGRNWRQISRIVGTRDSRQTKSHAQKFFIKLMKAGNPAYTADMFELDQDEVSCETEASDEHHMSAQALETAPYIGVPHRRYEQGYAEMQQALAYHLNEAARLFNSSLNRLLSQQQPGETNNTHIKQPD